MEDVLKTYIKKNTTTKNVAENIIDHIERLEKDGNEQITRLENQRDAFENAAKLAEKKVTHLRSELDNAHEKIQQLREDAAAQR